MTQPIVDLRKISKSFGKVLANDGVDLAIQPGTIHGIVGENGAGKSTVMKILFGLHQPDAGEIRIDGERRIWQSTKDASAAGIGMVHQHFMLSRRHTTLDNIILGVEPSASIGNLRALQVIDRKHARTELRVIMKMFDLHVDLDVPVSGLPIGAQQRVEILKVLYRKARILIFDEPTAVLTPQETDAFLLNLRKLRDEGKTIVLITHKLREILTCADTLTVMRQGKVVAHRAAAGVLEEALASLMVGRSVRLHVTPEEIPRGARPLLTVRNLTLPAVGRGKSPLASVSFDVFGGEILGVAGVDGNGQQELLAALADPASTDGLKGDFLIDGQSAKMHGNADLRDLGVAYIPADRNQQGLLPHAPAFKNFTLGHQFRHSYQLGGFMRWGVARRDTLAAMRLFDIRPLDCWTSADAFSGGNQQKLIFARELQFPPKIIIAANPTRGVDVGSIEFIHDQLLAARRRGCAILLISSELSEVMGLGDRLFVLFQGGIAGSFTRPEFDEDRIGLLMGRGAEPRTEAAVGSH